MRILGRRRIEELIALVMVLFISINCQSQTNNIRINEFLALNQNSVMDADSAYSDWIEIYNPTSQEVFLQNYALTDDENLPLKWVFPDVSIQPNEYILIFASGKDTILAGNEVHTNFRISGDGEYLALYQTDGTVVTEFSPVFPAQEADKSYGFYNGGYVFFDVPSPLTVNVATPSSVLSKPVFSHKHGFYNEPFSLEITHSVEGAVIHYTTDGSVPDQQSTIYLSPFTISTTTPVRAIAVDEGLSSSKATTATFIFLEDVLHQSNTPEGYPAEWGPYCQIQGTAIADYEMDPELVSDPAFAASAIEGLKDLPTISLVTDKNHLFSLERDENTGGIYIYTGTPVGDPIGRGWERPVSVEYFDGTDSVSLQVDCGIRLQGGHSRLPEKLPKHSFLLVFKRQYGPSKLNYPFYGENANDEFNTLTLRAGFGNSWIHHSHAERSRAQYQRDIWGKDTQRDMGHVSSHSIYAHLYINGLYWGVYAPSERMDDEFGGAYLEGQPKDFDVIKDYSELTDGVMDSWDELIRQANSDMTNHENFMKIQGKNPNGTSNAAYPKLVEMDNFIDYMLINFYAGNSDWDHHNWAAMRNRNNPRTGFSFFIWDAEHMVKGVNDNVMNRNNDGCPSDIFSGLRANEDFRRMVADRAMLHCYNGGALTPETAIARWNIRSAQVEKAVVPESARWGDYRRDVHPYQTSGPFDLYTKETHWLPQREYMLNTYFPQRTRVFLNQLRSENLFPDVDAPTVLLNNEFRYKSSIEKGDIVTMEAPDGTIYYTTDGSDPVVWASAQSDNVEEKVLIAGNADKKAFVPHSDIGNDWYSDLEFDDSAWKICSGSPGGIGYEKNTGYQSFISLDVGDEMHADGGNPSTTCLIRIPFEVTADDLKTFSSLVLSARYDDGFVAYLNGKEILSAYAPETVAWNSIATEAHEGEFAESFNISGFFGELKEGQNLLAIHGINRSITSSDFLFSVQLDASSEPPSGGISEKASMYSSEIELDKSSHIRARTYLNGEWSAMTSNYFVLPENYKDLRITEIHYHPEGTDSINDREFEFIEIKNVGDAAINLEGISFVAGIDYTFEKNVVLAAGEFVVLASSITNFGTRYGFYPYDAYKGQLDNNGEKIKVVSPLNDTIIAMKYEQDGDWPKAADGGGYSLVPVDVNPALNYSYGEMWRASFFLHGSPGKDDIDVDVPVILSRTSPEGKIELGQNYPNPFSDITYINYSIPEKAYVNIAVYSIVGQHIATLVDDYKNEGLHQVSWNGALAYDQLPKGFYIYRMVVKNDAFTKVISKKMMLLK